jgi:hypothetical protein
MYFDLIKRKAQDRINEVVHCTSSFTLLFVRPSTKISQKDETMRIKPFMSTRKRKKRKVVGEKSCNKLVGGIFTPPTDPQRRHSHRSGKSKEKATNLLP